MGNYTSRFFSHGSVEEHNEEITETIEQSNLEKECNNSSTHQQLLTDPRSLTTEICRTPIKINHASSNNTRMAVDVLSKNILKKPYLETNFDSTMSPSTLNKYLDPRSPNVDQPRTPISIDNFTSCKRQTVVKENNKEILPFLNFKHIESLKYDPRSPSTDFDRTPITVQRTTKYLQTESEENAGSYSETNDHLRYMYCETTSSDTPEILAVVDETCEAIKSLQFNNSDSISETKLHVSDNTNHMSNENVNNDSTYSMKNLQNRDLASINTIKIWRDSELSENLEQSEINEYSDQENDEEKFSYPSNEEIEVIFDDDDVIKRNKSIPEQLTIKTEDENKDVQDTLDNKKQVKTNKKTSILYNTNINKISKKRTPLGNRCNNAQLDTVLTNSSQNMLQKKNSNNLIQYENTLNHKKSYDKSKHNGIKWDVNSTVII